MVWKMFILGVVQGLSEFLPISSSGHLVLAKELLGFTDAGLTAVVFLHFGTLVALIVFFAKKIWRIICGAFSRQREARVDNWKLILFIVLASIPAALVGLLAREPLDRIFAQPLYVPFFLVGTGLLLLLTRWKRARQHSLGLSDALIIGIAQAAAILPGLSRSGLTIGTGLLLGLEEEEAFEFSFLLSIPAVAAANLLELKDIVSIGSPLVLVVGFGASFGVGLAALWLLRKLVMSKKFWLFSFYCFAVGVVSLIFLLTRG
jgi:undecaprenyl-diphosphatase